MLATCATWRTCSMKWVLCVCACVSGAHRCCARVFNNTLNLESSSYLQMSIVCPAPAAERERPQVAVAAGKVHVPDTSPPRVAGRE